MSKEELIKILESIEISIISEFSINYYDCDCELNTLNFNR